MLSLWLLQGDVEMATGELMKVGEYNDLPACTKRVRELDEALEQMDRGCLDDLMKFYEDAEIFAIDERGRKFTVVGEDEVTSCLVWKKS